MSILNPIKLSLITMNDSDELLSIFSDWSVWKNVIDAPLALPDMAKVREFIGVTAECEFGKGNPIYTIKKSWSCVGLMHLIFSDDKQSAEIKLLIGKKYQNKGIATAALNLLIKQLQRTSTLKTLIAQIYDKDLVSKRLFEKCLFNPCDGSRPCKVLDIQTNYKQYKGGRKIKMIYNF
jgi:RimJ/RimL family protein N-acetyltransferase